MDETTHSIRYLRSRHIIGAAYYCCMSDRAHPPTTGWRPHRASLLPAPVIRRVPMTRITRDSQAAQPQLPIKTTVTVTEFVAVVQDMPNVAVPKCPRQRPRSICITTVNGNTRLKVRALNMACATPVRARWVSPGLFYGSLFKQR